MFYKERFGTIIRLQQAGNNTRLTQTSILLTLYSESAVQIVIKGLVEIATSIYIETVLITQ